MVMPLKSLFNSCIGVRDSSNANMNEMEKKYNSGIELNTEDGEANSKDENFSPSSHSKIDECCEIQPVQQSELLCNGNDNMMHNVLCSNARISECGLNPEALSSTAFSHLHNLDIGCRQKTDILTVYGATHLPLMPRIHSCLNTDISCDSSSSFGHWCPTCRVKQQVESDVTAIQKAPPALQKSVENKRSLWSIFLPKKIKHKDKNSKDNERNKCLLLNNTAKSNQGSEIKQTHSRLNGGCTCCCLPRHDDFEYKLKDCQASTSGCSLHQAFSEMTLMEADSEMSVARNMADSHAILPMMENLPRMYPADLPFYFKRSSQGERAPRNRAVPHQRVIHTQMNFIHCLVPDLLAITNCGFYWGKMDRYEAERLIENKPEGTFLLRDSAQEDYLFSVSFCRHERSLHARIEQSNHKFSFDPLDPGVFSSDTVCGLLEFYKDPSCCMFYDPVLTNPLPRTFPFPLQHLCRSTICSTISYNGISQLQLPRTLKNYLKEYHYKQKVSVTHYD